MDRGRNSPLAMNGADAQEYFACIITMLSFQRSLSILGFGSYAAREDSLPPSTVKI
ncbi:hypothetical protein DV515_00002520, partial [Chloebia gouldiae]